MSITPAKKAHSHVLFVLLISVMLLPQISFSREHAKAVLRYRINKIIDSLHANVGVGLMGLDFADTLVINAEGRFPMQSVFKFPLAVAILSQFDQGKLSLSQKIHIPRGSLDTHTWSPMVHDFPDRDLDISLADLLVYTVSKSDNNGCDILFGLAGGTRWVNKYIHSVGVTGISIVATEGQMKKAWEVQYTNWCQPGAMLRLLQLFYNGKLLSNSSNAFLMKIMTESENSPNRIKGLLPANAIVAHKTGTSDTNERGIKAATNDAGIITLPDGRHYAIVVYVSDYKGGAERGERVIAEISKAAWDYFSVR